MKTRLVLIFIIYLPSLLCAQQDLPKHLCGNKLHVGDRFYDVQLIYPGLKWFSSTYDYKGSTQSYLLSGKIWDNKFTYLEDSNEKTIVNQTINYQGNKTIANKLFLQAIKDLKEQGGYNEIVDRKYSQNLCLAIYDNYKIVINIGKVENSNIYIVHIDITSND